MDPKRKGEYRLKAIPLMSERGMHALALSTSVLKVDYIAGKGGKVTFGVDEARATKLVTETAFTCCLVIDLKEWDEVAAEIPKMEAAREAELNRYKDALRLISESRDTLTDYADWADEVQAISEEALNPGTNG